LPQQDYVSITYEELCQHPAETLETIMERLSMTIGQTVDAASFMKPRSVAVDSSVKKFQKQMYRLMKPYWDRFNYTTEG